jgi:hypothetical protein
MEYFSMHEQRSQQNKTIGEGAVLVLQLEEIYSACRLIASGVV